MPWRWTSSTTFEWTARIKSYSSRLNFPSFLIFSSELWWKVSNEWRATEESCSSLLALQRHRFGGVAVIGLLCLLLHRHEIFSRSYSPPPPPTLWRPHTCTPLLHACMLSSWLSTSFLFKCIRSRIYNMMAFCQDSNRLFFSSSFSLHFPFTLTLLPHSHISLSWKCPPRVHWLKFASNANKKETVL